MTNRRVPFLIWVQTKPNFLETQLNSIRDLLKIFDVDFTKLFSANLSYDEIKIRAFKKCKELEIGLHGSSVSNSSIMVIFDALCSELQ